MTAKEAVDRSTSHDEIVSIEAADKAEAKTLIADLEAIAFEAGYGFGYTPSNEGYETWAFRAGTENEMVWRVHIEVEAIERDDDYSFED
jgi:hypothetical protein